MENQGMQDVAVVQEDRCCWWSGTGTLSVKGVDGGDSGGLISGGEGGGGRLVIHAYSVMFNGTFDVRGLDIHASGVRVFVQLPDKSNLAIFGSFKLSFHLSRGFSISDDWSDCSLVYHVIGHAPMVFDGPTACLHDKMLGAGVLQRRIWRMG
jgi:hypothetical protein